MEQQFSLFVDSKLDSPKNLYLGRVMGELGPALGHPLPLWAPRRHWGLLCPVRSLSSVEDKLSPPVFPQRPA